MKNPSSTQKLSIATCRNRHSAIYTNRQIAWEEIVKKLSTTHRTAETYATYMTEKKERQDEIKDVGGFVGGYLVGGKRKKTTIQFRQLLTLDADFAHSDIWEDFTLLYDCAAAIYSTHKHNREKPRYRIVMPLSREVSPAEYVPIARRVAEYFGIEYFDPTSYQPERLMYWPSTSKDGEFEFQHQDGPWLDADEILSTYKNWQDSSEWPMGDKEKENIRSAIRKAKQQDPTEKEGLVGAFCRTYTIAEVMEKFLADVYSSTDTPDRYTYTNGSTYGGLIVYEDKYAYSHHGTDPVSGKLCNAFDLVRLHKYGEEKNSNEAMLEFVTKDKRTVATLVREKMQKVEDEFSEGIDDEDGDNWLQHLDADKKGNFYSTRKNVQLILRNDDQIKNKIKFNIFSGQTEIITDLPWRKKAESPYWSDEDDAQLRIYLEKKYGISSAAVIDDCLVAAAKENSFHPVRDYLNSLTWDGVKRIESLLPTYLGAEKSEYVSTVTRKMLVAAVARIFEPGIKYDYVLVLISDQGKKKSMLLNKLGGEWFSDSLTTMHGKEAIEQLQGVWLIEIAELSAMRKAEAETVKHFITRQIDIYRPAYGRRIESKPRQCVFFATSNKLDFLQDPTGNRRFWPVQININTPLKDVAKMEQEEIDQIWAEAIEIYKEGEKLYLNEEMETIAMQMQTDHTEADDRAGLIQEWLDILLPLGWEKTPLGDRRAYFGGFDIKNPVEHGKTQRTRVCAAEIWCELFGEDKSKMSAHTTRFIHSIMRNMPGWKPGKSKTVVPQYGNQSWYQRVEGSPVSPINSSRKRTYGSMQLNNR